jgi:hypothetical protein
VSQSVVASTVLSLECSARSRQGTLRLADAVSDVAPPIELTSRYQPLTGPMLIPAS